MCCVEKSIASQGWVKGASYLKREARETCKLQTSSFRRSARSSSAFMRSTKLPRLAELQTSGFRRSAKLEKLQTSGKARSWRKLQASGEAREAANFRLPAKREALEAQSFRLQAKREVKLPKLTKLQIHVSGERQARETSQASGEAREASDFRLHPQREARAEASGFRRSAKLAKFPSFRRHARSAQLEKLQTSAFRRSAKLKKLQTSGSRLQASAEAHEADKLSELQEAAMLQTKPRS